MTSPDQNKTWLSSKDAARLLGVSDNYLRKLRIAGTGPTFVKVGPRCVRYAREELDRWMAERAKRSTSEPDRAAQAA